MLVDKLDGIEVGIFPISIGLFVQVFIGVEEVHKVGTECFRVVEFVLSGQQPESHCDRLVNFTHSIRIVRQFLVCGCDFLQRFY